jgi:hypothetical protein
MFASKSIAVASISLGALIGACGHKVVSFREDVHPILQRDCAVCHSTGGVGYNASGFSVANYATVMKGTRYGPMVVPGSSLQSNLVWLLKHEAHSSIDMPKSCVQMTEDGSRCAVPSRSARRLPEQQVTLIAEWVDQGARNN